MSNVLVRCIICYIHLFMISKEVFKMKDTFLLNPVHTDQQLQEIADLASVIWHEHFTPIIGVQQVEYMLEKFQSFSALKSQIESGYEYFQIFDNAEFCGYCGVHSEENKLFLSKLYIKKEARNRHLSTKTLQSLKALCQKRGLTSIWLTCNKYNANTLAVYHHLGFETIRSQVADIGNGYVMDDYILECRV